MGVATGIAIAGLAVSAAGTAGSFISASKQRKLQKEAEADADKAMAQARKALEINYYDVLGVNKEPYELQREAMISQGQQAIQAAQEGDRGAAAAAGRVQMAMNEGQAQIRTAMGKEMQDIQKLQVGEDSRLRDVGVQLDLAEVEGAQQAASDAQKAAAQYTQAGIQGLSNMGKSMMSMAPLYGGGLDTAGKGMSMPSLGGATGSNMQGVAIPQGQMNSTLEALRGQQIMAGLQNPFNFNGQYVEPTVIPYNPNY